MNQSHPGQGHEVCNSCGGPAMHTVGGSVHQCCRCYVFDGQPPADWHAGCLLAERERDATPNFKPAGLMTEAKKRQEVERLPREIPEQDEHICLPCYMRDGVEFFEGDFIRGVRRGTLAEEEGHKTDRDGTGYYHTVEVGQIRFYPHRAEFMVRSEKGGTTFLSQFSDIERIEKE